MNSHGNVTIGASTTSYTAVTSFYTLPRTGAPKAACLKLALSIDGTDYTLPVYINSGALGGNTANNENLSLDITANKVYKVDVALGRQSVTVAADILEWFEKSVNGDIQGSSLVVDSLVLVNAGVNTPVLFAARPRRSRRSFPMPRPRPAIRWTAPIPEPGCWNSMSSTAPPKFPSRARSPFP